MATPIRREARRISSCASRSAPLESSPIKLSERSASFLQFVPIRKRERPRGVARLACPCLPGVVAAPHFVDDPYIIAWRINFRPVAENLDGPALEGFGEIGLTGCGKDTGVESAGHLVVERRSATDAPGGMESTRASSRACHQDRYE